MVNRRAYENPDQKPHRQENDRRKPNAMKELETSEQATHKL